MTEEEKKAIEFFSKRLEKVKTAYTSLYFRKQRLQTLLNLIQKQDTEINKLKEEKEELEQRLQEIELQILEEEI